MQNQRIQKAQTFMNDARAFLHGKHFDSSVSRCYYALYHLAIALLEKQGIRSEEWAHGFVLSEFGRLFVHRRKVFSKESHGMLYTIQRERNEADYNILPVSAKKAKRIFDKTQNLWNTLYKEVKHEQEEEKRQ